MLTHIANLSINHKTVVSFDVSSNLSNYAYGTFTKLSIVLDFDVYEFNIDTTSFSKSCACGTWYTKTPNIDHVYQEEILDYNYWLGETITNIAISQYEDSEKLYINVDFINNGEIIFSIVFYHDIGCGSAFHLIINHIHNYKSLIIYEGFV